MVTAYRDDSRDEVDQHDGTYNEYRFGHDGLRWQGASMTDSTLEVQKAVVAALKADAAVTGFVGTRIYDQSPQAPTYPLIIIGDVDGDPWEADDMDGWEGVYAIDCWSTKPGKVEALQIAKAVTDALHAISLTLDSQTWVMGEIIGSTTHTDLDTKATQARRRYLFRTHA